MQGRFDISDEECYHEWIKTKNAKMIHSITRMVFLKNKKDGHVDNFLMTIVGKKDYNGNKTNKLAANTYLNREKNFSGYIYYFDLNGNFVNGWIYEKGEIVGITNLVEGDGLPTNLKMAITCVNTTKYSTYVQCTDWYADSNHNGTYDVGIDQYTGYTCGDVFTAMAIYTECPVYFTGGGMTSVTYLATTAGGTSGGYVPVEPKKYQQILHIDYLDQTQTDLLEQALNDMINEGCLAKSLYSSLVGRGASISFKMNTNSQNTAPAYYNPNDKSISFYNNNTINSESIKEELYHAFQDTYYNGGISQYQSTGKSNVEFEAKLFKQLVGDINGGCCYVFQNVPVELQTKYIIWVDNIKASGSISTTDYLNWLNLFNQYETIYSSPTSPYLSTPSALISIINSCNN